MTTTQKKSNYLEQEVKFLQAIEKCTNKDNGAKAVFKRAMSGEPEHIRRVYQFVLPYVGNASEWEQNEIWIPVACLAIYYPQTIREPEQQRNFGHSCQGLAKATNSDSKGTDRRFRALLDLSLTDMQSSLTALIRQMKSKGIAIDYPKLLADLRQWEHPNQYIQDQWARTFWGAPSSDQE